MPDNVIYCELPTEIHQWAGLPLSLNGDEVMPLDYRADHRGWLLYGKKLDKACITNFQQRSGRALVIVTAWCVEDYQVVHLAGGLTPKMKVLANESGLDVAPLGKIPNLRAPGLLVMDMNSTAIQIKSINEIAKLAGVADQVSEITRRFLQGELDFTTSLYQRLAALKGVDADVLEQVRDQLPLTPGLTTLVSRLQALQWQVAIISGGFSYYADRLRDKLELVSATANELEINNGRLTGRLIGPVMDGRHKADTLLKLVKTLGLPISQTVAVGDSENDVKMLKTAGFSIAFHTQPIVYAKAQVAIHHGDLMSVFCILTGGLKHE